MTEPGAAQQTQPPPKRPPVPRNVIEPDPRYLISPGTLLAVAGAFLGVGVVIGLKFTMKQRAAKGTTWKAIKALVGGTAICAAGTGAITFGVFKYFGVSNIREFSDKMREKVPEQADKIRDIIQPKKEQLDETLHSIPYFPKKAPLPDVVVPTLPPSPEEEKELAEIDEMLMYKDETQSADKTKP